MARGISSVAWRSGLGVAALVALVWGPVAARAGGLADAVADRVAAALTLQGLPFLAIQDVEALRVEIRDLVAARGPKDLPETRQAALLNAVDPYVAEHFSGKTPDQTYLDFRDQWGTLKWALCLALNRKDLAPDQLQALEEQHQWMRGYIDSLKDHPQFGTRAGETAKLEGFLADPFFPPFQEPMTDAQFAAFKKPLERERGAHAGNACGQLITRALMAVFPISQLPRMELPFDDKALFIPFSNEHYHMTFKSNEPFRVRSMSISGLGRRKDTLFDLTRITAWSCPADLGEAELAKWLRGADKGDLAYGEKAKALLALRGAKIALLDAATWFAADALSDPQVRDLLAQHGADRIPLASFRFRETEHPWKSPIAFVAVERPQRGLDVVRVKHWVDKDFLQIAARPRASSLLRRRPEKAEAEPAPPPAAAADEPLPPPEYAKLDSFTELSAKLTLSHHENRKVQMAIQSDGSTAYSLQARALGKEISHSSRLRLAAADLRHLERLLAATDWLTQPIAAKEIRIEDGGEVELSLVRAGATRRVVGAAFGDGPYGPLLSFFWRLDRQEQILYQLTEGDAAARGHAAGEIAGDLRAMQCGTGGLGPSRACLDYGRFVPVFAKIVADPAARPDELDAAYRLMCHLRVESHRKAVEALATDPRLRTHSGLIGVLAAYGDERAARVLAAALPDRPGVGWDLIRMGKAAEPAIVDVLTKPGGPYKSGAYQLIREYLDHWKELPGPLDPAVVDGVRKGLEAARWGGAIIQYHEEFLRLAASSPPPPGPLACDLHLRNAPRDGQPYAYTWHLARYQPVRILHGWYTLADGKVMEHGSGACDKAPADTPCALSLAFSEEAGSLVLELTRTDWRPDGSLEPAKTRERLPIPAAATRQGGGQFTGAVRLTERPLILWKADYAQDGKPVRTLVYAARIADKDDAATGFAPPPMEP